LLDYRKKQGKKETSYYLRFAAIETDVFHPVKASLEMFLSKLKSKAGILGDLIGLLQSPQR